MHPPARRALLAALALCCALPAAARGDAGTSGIEPGGPARAVPAGGVPVVPGHADDPVPPGNGVAAPPAERQGSSDARHRVERLSLPLRPYGGNWVTLPPAVHGPHCAASGERQYMLVYAWRATTAGGNGDRYTAAAPRVSEAWNRTSSYLAHQSLRQGGPVLRLRTACAQVFKIRATGTTPAAIWKQVRDELNGVGTPWYAKAMVFADFPLDGEYGVGVGNLRRDDTPSASNANNKPSQRTDLTNGHQCSDFRYSFHTACGYGIVYERWATYEAYDPGLMHEVGHTMGAVQPSAPNEYNGFHCFDGVDVMCYGTVAGDLGAPDGTYGDHYCAPDDAWRGWSPYSFSVQQDVVVPPFDCAADHDSRLGVHFNADGDPGDFFFAPSGGLGPYLGAHWNVARGYHGFVKRDDGSP